jgi:biopolymer transport protein ExbB/TolQ
MKNRFIVIYTVFAAAVFIFSITFFGYNLFNEYNTNQKKSELKFTELVNDIRTLSYAQDENTAAYSQGIKKAIGEAADYSFIQVRRNNETVVLYPTGKSREETVSKLTKSYTSSLTVNKQNISVDCNLYLICPDSIFYFARISFLMILIITIITIIMIIYLNLSSASSDVVSIEEDEVIAESESDSYSDSETESEEKEDTSEVQADEEIIEESESTESEETADTNKEIPDYFEENKIAEENTDEEVIEEEKNSEVTPEEVKAIFAEPLTDQQAAEAAEAAKKTEPAKLPLDEVMPARDSSNEPAGLFNPDTGIGWESYLLTRLNNEIERATASEIDLSLFIIKLSAVEKGSVVYKNVCNYLSIIFQFKDLLFEYKEDCIVAIKISMNVDEALKMADKLYNDISNLVNNRDTRIGISSRSIRMVGGERLLLEAEQSIEHSDKSSPVIAFRVDSEKYRKLMEANQ